MEGKRRTRPTWKQVRELEGKVAALTEVLKLAGDIEAIVRDNTVYRQAMMNFSAMIRVKKEPAILCQGSEECEGLVQIVFNDIKNRWDEDANKLTSENRALKRSNVLMEAELRKLRSEVDLYREIADNRATEVEALKGRGILDRLLNR